MEGPNDKSNMLSGNINKLMWALSLPSILAMALWGMNTLSDAIFVGQLLGAEALAGVALAIPYTAITLGMGQWVGNGAANILSNAIGEKNTAVQKKILPQVLLLSLIGSVLTALPLYYFAEDLLRLTGGTGAILTYGVQYLKVSSFGTFFWIYGMALNLIIRAEGRMRKSATMIAYALLINILFTPLLISQAGLEADGAAWAINAGMLVYTVLQLLYFKKGTPSFSIQFLPIKWDKDVTPLLLKTGLPAFLYNVITLVQSIIVFNLLADYGSAYDIAVFAGINAINLFLTTPLFGLMQAFQPMAGLNFGAGNTDRIRKAFSVFVRNGLLLIIPLWLLLLFFPSRILGLLLRGDVTETAVTQFWIVVAPLPMMPFLLVSLALLPAVKKSSQASYIILLRQVVLFVPLMLLLPKIWGVNGIYIASAIINAAATAIAAIFVFKTLKFPNG